MVELLEIICDTGTGLYIHTQSVDTTTPADRAMFGMLGIFSEFECEMIVTPVNAGLARARDTIVRDDHFVSKAGKKRKRLGRNLATVMALGHGAQYPLNVPRRRAPQRASARIQCYDISRTLSN